MRGLSEGLPAFEAYSSKRYLATFKSGALELENESDDLQEVKSWIVNLIKDYPSPDHAVITDRQEEENVFEERNEDDNQEVL